MNLIFIYMSGEQGDSQRCADRYWEQVLRESEETFQKQTDALQSKRSTLAGLIKYHFIIFGFVVTLFSAGITQGDPLVGWFLAGVILLSILIVSLTIRVHNSTGSYYTGLSFQEYQEIAGRKDDYSDALIELTARQLEMADKNRAIIEQSNSYIFYNWSVLFLSAGVLLGLILP